MAAPVEAAPVAVNEGLNLQYAVAAGPGPHSGPGLLATLLATGAAVGAARRGRAQARHV